MDNSNMDSRLSLPGSLLSRTLNVLAITRELDGGELNGNMIHSWKPHEVLTIRQFCKSNGLVAFLNNTDIGEPVASLVPRGGYEEAVAGVSRRDIDGMYILIDDEGGLIKEGTSLLDVLQSLLDVLHGPVH